MRQRLHTCDYSVIDFLSTWRPPCGVVQSQRNRYCHVRIRIPNRKRASRYGRQIDDSRSRFQSVTIIFHLLAIDYHIGKPEK